jgi:hypothetical protein
MRIIPWIFPVLLIGLFTACGTASETRPGHDSLDATEPQLAEPVSAMESQPEPAIPAAAELTQASPVPPKAHAIAKRKKPVSAEVKTRAKALQPAPEPEMAEAFETEPMPHITELDKAHAAALVEDLLRRFLAEQAQFDTPASMTRGMPGSATLTFLSPGALDEVRERLAANEQIKKANVRISNRVEATLVGDGIDIRSGESRMQELSATAPSRWQWELQPITEGKGTLHLMVGMETSIDDDPASRVTHTLDRELMVKGAAVQQAGGFGIPKWLWMLIAVASGAGAVIVAMRARKA